MPATGDQGKDIMALDRRFLLCGFAYAIAGMGLGIYMAASHNHALFVAHAHMLLLGFVVSFIYALICSRVSGARTALDPGPSLTPFARRAARSRR